jgi:hypothetical protein
MPDLRAPMNLNSIAMKGWVGSGKVIGVYNVGATSDMSSFTTEVDITGCSVSVVLPGSSNTILAFANVDMSIATSGASFSCFFNWNGGSDQTNQCLFVNPSATVTNRFNGMQTWVLTGIAAGTYTAKMRASCTASNAGNKITAANTTLTVIAIASS